MRFRSRVPVGFALAATALAATVVAGPRIGTGGVAAAAVTFTQASATAVVPYTPYPSTGTDLYVYNRTGDCSDSGPGTNSQPFCTIAEAASVVQPGQTVVVEPGTYTGTTISAQGTSQAPVTFDSVEGATVNAPAGEPTFTISGASNVEFDGFSAFGGSRQGFYVTGGSSGITINGGYADTGSGSIPAVEVDGTTSGVTVSRMAIEARMPVQVDAGASGAVITGNSILPDLVGTWGVLVTGAPGTDVVGNTIHAICSGGISIAGASTGVTVENNVVQPVTSGGSNPCSAGTAISVSADSEANTVVNFNLIDPSAGESLYDWGGTSYTGLADFQTASGQSLHDIVANPDLGQQTFGTSLIPGPNVFWFPPSADSPAINSAIYDAPGELGTDQFGNPRTDAGPGVVGGIPTPDGVFFDRGAVEVQGPTVTTAPAATSTGPLTATWSMGLSVGFDNTNGGSQFIVGVSFGDGTPEEVGRPWKPAPRAMNGDGIVSVQHTYTIAGLYNVHYEYSTGTGGVVSAETQVVVGAAYTPVSPVRILDTRNGTGTGKAAPVAANGTLTLPIPRTDGVPAADMSAVVMNVTVTKPTRGGNLTVYPGSGSVPLVSNLNFSAGETVPNLVTVQVRNGEVSFRNNSGGTVQVVADLEGFYGPGGYGFKPIAPVRVLDTRNGTGAALNGVRGPIAAGGVLREHINVPVEVTAVVLNVTVTQPERGGYLTLYPDGETKPNASNLNFSAGETVPNLVIVPVKDQVLDIANTSGGTVQVVADLEGYFGPDDLTPDLFVPYGPTREVDTRTVHSPLTAHETYTVNILRYPGCNTQSCPAAMVDNVTVAAPTRGGVLIVYPAGQPRPLASNLNFSAGETVPNLAIAQGGGGNGQISFYNQSGGQLQLIVDEFGYFMPPPVGP